MLLLSSDSDWKDAFLLGSAVYIGFDVHQIRNFTVVTLTGGDTVECHSSRSLVFKPSGCGFISEPEQPGIAHQ